MTLPIRLVAVDLDGTLLTSAGQPAREGMRALREAAQKGTRVIIATTRTLFSSRMIAQELEIQDPMICMNGAQVWESPQGPLWFEKSMPREAALAIARLADENNWELSIAIGPVTFWKQRPGMAPGPAGPGRQIVAANLDAFYGDHADKAPVRILVDQADAIQAISQLCQTQFADTCRADLFCNSDGTPHSLGVFAAGADKRNALELVLKRLGIAPEQALAIGDNFNDTPMFEIAGLSAAMGNAVEAVKRKATLVAPDHDHEGVAWVVRNYIL